MLNVNKNISGGYLSCPEYDFALSCENGLATFFYNDQILHGVTPFKLLNKESYRYTVVYYSLSALAKCMTCREELERTNRVKMELAQRQAK